MPRRALMAAVLASALAVAAGVAGRQFTRGRALGGWLATPVDFDGRFTFCRLM